MSPGRDTCPSQSGAQRMGPGGQREVIAWVMGGSFGRGGEMDQVSLVSCKTAFAALCNQKVQGQSSPWSRIDVVRPSPAPLLISAFTTSSSLWIRIVFANKTSERQSCTAQERLQAHCSRKKGLPSLQPHKPDASPSQKLPWKGRLGVRRCGGVGAKWRPQREEKLCIKLQARRKEKETILIRKEWLTL